MLNQNKKMTLFDSILNGILTLSDLFYFISMCLEQTIHGTTYTHGQKPVFSPAIYTSGIDYELHTAGMKRTKHKDCHSLRLWITSQLFVSPLLSKTDRMYSSHTFTINRVNIAVSSQKRRFLFLFLQFV